MSNTVGVKKPTLRSLAAEMRRLKERLEDIEDLIELRSAVERNAGKPGVPWEKVKAELELD
jgi:tetrahydromethanopterin S-methyltransferase subunit G